MNDHSAINLAQRALTLQLAQLSTKVLTNDIYPCLFAKRPYSHDVVPETVGGDHVVDLFDQDCEYERGIF